MAASKEGIYIDNQKLFSDRLTSWYKSVLTLNLDENSFRIVAGTNRGLVEISKDNSKVTTIKTWFLHTPISKV